MRKTGLLLSIACCTSSLPTIARAEDAPSLPASGEIVVTAQRLEKTARSEEKTALNIVDIQSAETIAKYPDVNAAEALSRIPGVSLSIDTAEGRFVNIRGLDGNLNGATFGGVVLLNTQPGGTYFNASGRAVEFDTVPIGAIDRIVVTKTGLPDHEAEGLGGSVELTPRTAIGAKAPFAEITLGGGIETFAGKGLYRDEIVVGAPFGHRADGGSIASIVLTQFLYNDWRSFDDLEAAYIDDQPATPDKAFDALEARHYDYHRQRFGYSGEFDVTPNDQQRIYLRASMAGYNESVLRNRLEIDGLGDAVTVDPANPSGLVATGASTVKGLRDEDETHRNIVVQLGGEHQLGSGLRFDWFGAFSRASYLKHYDRNATFAGPTDLVVAYDNTTDPNHPTFSATGPSISDNGNYVFDGFNNSTEYSRDREWSTAANLGLPLNLTPGDELKVGGKLRWRRKIAEPSNYNYDFGGANPPLTQFNGSTSLDNFYGYIPLGGTIDAPSLASYADANAILTSNLARNASGFFDDREDVSAAYMQYSGTLGTLGLLAGARVEHTYALYSGNAQVTDASGNVSYVPASQTNSYTNIFPTVQLKDEFTPALIGRATWSTGIARPGFYQTTQSDQIDVGAQTASTGNPNLKPTYGNNFDVSLAYYLPNNGVISIGVFDKEFRNFIVTRSVRGPLAGYGNLIFLQDSYENVSDAYARGIEGQIVYRLGGAGGLLDGFGIDANATYVDSAVTLRDGQGKVPLPGTFDFSANAALFYEMGPIKARLAGQYESPVLFGVGGSRATDVFQDKRFTLDANASYDVTPALQVYVNAKNLTNAPLRFYEGSSNRPIQREYYDATIEAGVKLKL